jgi:hypothetical protein
MRKIIVAILTCTLFILCLSGCSLVDKIFGSDDPSATQPTVIPNDSNKVNEYDPNDQFLCSIDGVKYYMHMKVSDIKVPSNSNRVLAYLAKNDNGASRYKAYENLSETVVPGGESSVIYLYNYLSEGVSAVINVYNNTDSNVTIGECRINGMTVYRSHLSSQNITFNGFEFISTLSAIETFMGLYDNSTVSSNGSYYQYSWHQFGHLQYTMTVYIYKNTGKIMSVMFETKDVVDANGNIKPSGNTDDNSEADPDIPTEPDPTDPEDPEINLVLNTGDLRVYLEKVTNVDGYPKLLFYVENRSAETFNFVIDDIYAGKRIIDTSAWIIDTVPGNSDCYVEFYVKSSEFEGNVDIKKDETLILDVILDSSMRQEQKSGYRIDISDLTD